jgi:hypothetical protein
LEALSRNRRHSDICRKNLTADGLLRRHQYAVDVLGNASGLNYAADYRSVSGVMVPTRRRVFSYDGEKWKIPEPWLVAIDIRETEFS